MLYPAFLVILLVARNVWGAGDYREDSQIEVTENSLFYCSKPLNAYQSTHTYILLAALIHPKCSRG
jgi:hypothetical protein